MSNRIAAIAVLTFLGGLGFGLLAGCALFYADGWADGECHAVCSSPFGRTTDNGCGCSEGVP